jgi:nicotinate-nucleotide adenylyltransferase
MSEKIGLFGGSFDPVHIAHMIVASSVKQEFSLDRVIFMPNFLSPFKTNSTASCAEHRLSMLKIATEGAKGFEVSDFEIKKNRPVFTFETVEYLSDKYPGDEIFLIIGKDSYMSLGKWKNFSTISGRCGIIVADRPVSSSENDPEYKGTRVEFSKLCPKMDISSTMIRKMVADNFDIKYLVNDGVCDYIIELRLYKC